MTPSLTCNVKINKYKGLEEEKRLEVAGRLGERAGLEFLLATSNSFHFYTPRNNLFTTSIIAYLLPIEYNKLIPYHLANVLIFICAGL